jgi:spermidine synthase
VYAINTLGAIIGSFMAGFILIPWLGARNSILIAVAMNILIAGILFLRAPTPALSRRVGGAVATAVIAGLIWYPLAAWDASVLSSGPYLYTDRYQNIASTKKIDLRAAMLEGREFLYFKEGLHAVVAVEKNAAWNLTLQVNGKADASAKGDAATQLMLGHLPLLLHQSAGNVLVIGLGIGMTLGAVEQHPVKSVDVVEIEPAVVEASSYFKDFTGDALNDPRVNLIVGDGRNHLALTNRQYDVIISEPSNPWVSGMANLFTREFFELAKKRLREDGVMCQWVQAYSMSSIDFKTIVGTFRAVFPRVAVWEASFGGDYLLIGSLQELKVDYPMLLDRLGDKRIRADLSKMRIQNPATFLDKLVLTDKAVVEYTRQAPLHTDDNARLEYSAPKALLQARSTLLLEELYRFRPRPGDLLSFLKRTQNLAQLEKDLSPLFQAKKLTLDGFIRYAKGAAREAIKNFEDALAISPKNYDATELLAKLNFEIASQYKNARRLVKATAAYEISTKAIDNFVAGDRDLLSDYFALEVIYAKAYLDLGVMALNANRLKQAAAALEKSVAGEVRFAEAHNNLGVVYARFGKDDEAAKHYRLAIELNPLLVSARMNFGNLLLRQKKYQEAIASYHQVRELKPDFAITNYNLGMAYFMLNLWKKAESEWMRALELKPDLAQAQQGLKVVREKIGSP